MSSEEQSFLDGVQLPGEVEEDPIESRILGLDNDNGLNPPEVLQSFAATEKPKFIPKVPKASVTSTFSNQDHLKGNIKDAAESEVRSDGEIKLLKQQIKDMEDAVRLLVAGRDGIKLKAAKLEAKPIDWAKAKEADIFDMDIPIELVGSDLPDYMNVELKDSNFSPRWVHKMSRRLGPMKAKGFTFVKADEIEGELNLAITVDENGVFKHDDVILMKIEKRLYYGMLRRNHTKALQLTDPKAAHKLAQARIITDMQNAQPEDRPEGSKQDQTRPGDFERYVERNKLEVYI